MVRCFLKCFYIHLAFRIMYVTQTFIYTRILASQPSPRHSLRLLDISKNFCTLTNCSETTTLLSIIFWHSNSVFRPRYVGNGKLFHFWVNTFFIDQQRTSSLTHDSSLGAPAPPASHRSIRVTQVTPGWPPEPDVPPRGWRSAHTSGDNLDPDSPLPNPRVLTNSLSHGNSSDPHSQGSSEDQVRPPCQMSSDVSCFHHHVLFMILLSSRWWSLLLHIFHALKASLI